MPQKPIIGVTPCSRVDDYVESVRQAGGEPIVLTNADDPASVLSRVDGVLLTGGPDVDPAFYDEAPHHTTSVNEERDSFELPLSRQALALDVPLFAICRGVQVLNVAGGGSLVQDIPSQTSTSIDHSVEQSKNAVAHDVQVIPGSRLAGALRNALVADTCPVNSRHHQSVGRVAPSFTVSASSPDGIIEAIERPSAAFCLGVQWHPENFWRTGEFQPLFEAFVAAARKRMDQRKTENGKRKPES